MTNEEAKRRIEICRDFLANNYSDMGEPNFMAFDMAIKALEQELKIGHWSNKCVCSVCGNQPWYYGSTFRKDYKFCPYCGARMESEDET